MSAPAWMPLYPADYLADTGHLSTLEHGAYLLLILHYWQHGALPADDAKLARIARLPAKQWAAIRGTMAGLFTAGDWRHKRIDSELANADRLTSKRSAAGKAGASARYGNGIANAVANAEQTDGIRAYGLQPQPQDSSELRSSSSPSEREPPPPEIRPKPSPTQLRDRLVEAAAGNVATGTASIEIIKPILDLQASGLDLEADILPVIRDRVPKMATPLRTWSATWLVKEIRDHAEARKQKAAAVSRSPSGMAWPERAALCRRNAKSDGSTIWFPMEWGPPDAIPAEHRRLFAGLVIEGVRFDAEVAA